MDIKISPRENSSIKKEIEFKLGEYTIFAGENNAGKTNLMESLRSVLPQEQTIYIPAESIKAIEHMKTGAATDPMRYAFLQLIDVIVDELPSVNYEVVEDFLNKISSTFNSFNVPNIKLELDVTRLTKENIAKIVKDEVSKKILNSVVKDSYGTGCDLKIEDVGQGTQRLIIAAILQELGKAKAKPEELFLIFEEPEIYLHPKIKRALHEALIDISQSNIKVILTTHDPYFIELGVGQTIYNVIRDNDGATLVIPPLLVGVLDNPTYAEVNYVIFDVPSTDYLLQLCQQAKDKNLDFESYEIESSTIKEIRDSLAHKPGMIDRNSKRKTPVVGEDLKKKVIDYLRNIV